ncbi:FkbM family methyltransferase [Nitratireductor sp. XY-223]|uniref:FkbM family methyltransferase n=1 Tax=Nitratireductor sp. XY-223 TaxID=2561926 RepID=UPI0010AA13B0|nr:FkbM family methyltransferase [Nitratireductor sp. XY-223]
MSRLSVKIRALRRAIDDMRVSFGSARYIHNELKRHSVVQRAIAARIFDRHISEAFRELGSSSSQNLQDLFVLTELDMMRGGYFVEFGAADGIVNSNTYLLETQYGWNGLVAEPARCWHDALPENRKCSIDLRCLWHTSGQELEFSEADNGEISTISQFQDADKNAADRKNAVRYQVETVSLDDLLAQHKAPRRIDYLSIDTEGSEFEILNAFDFDRYDIRVITCEHNFTPQRDKILALLSSKGYTRKFREISAMDDWYVRR